MLKEELHKAFQELELFFPLDNVSDGLVPSDEPWIKFDFLAQMQFVRDRTHWIVNSVDTLAITDTIDFIEFKNQPIGNIDKFRLARKGVSSLKLLKILMTSFGLVFDRSVANAYVLVYSSKKSHSRLYATEALHRRRDFYFLMKRLVHQRALYKEVLIISDKVFVKRYTIPTY